MFAVHRGVGRLESEIFILISKNLRVGDGRAIYLNCVSSLLLR